MASNVARRPDPATDLRLARLHLRMGQLGLARAELEALAGSGDLDDAGLLALAEARWRTGDLAGAGEAAQAYLAPGGDDVTALVIAAEAVAAVGRPGEARRIAGRALEQADVPLDRIFAGMPRSSIWPADPADAAQPTLFGAEPVARRGPVRAGPIRAEAPEAGDEDRPRSTGPGLWDTETVEPDLLPDPVDLIDAAREAFDGGDARTAAVKLAIALRAAPELAPAILELTEPARRRTPEVELARGDAFRLVGRELDARRCYAAAAASPAARPAKPPAPAPIHGADRARPSPEDL